MSKETARLAYSDAGMKFCDEVGKLVEQNYGHSDGDDLCFRFLEMGRIDMDDGVDSAARYVAQMIEQA